MVQGLRFRQTIAGLGASVKTRRVAEYLQASGASRT